MVTPDVKPVSVSTSLPPKTKGLPLVGSIPQLFQQKMNFLVAERARLGDIFIVNLAGMDLYVLGHPRHAQHVLRDQARLYDKGGALWNALRGVAGAGLVTNNDWEFWLRQRRMIQPHFHRERLTQLVPVMRQAIDEAFGDLPTVAGAQQPFDLTHHIARASITVSIQTLFGTYTSASQTAEMEHAIKSVLDYIIWATLMDGLPSYAPRPGFQRFKQQMAVIDDHTYDVLRRCRENEGENTGLMALLLDMVDDETNEQMTDKQLRDEAMTMILAGSETSAVAVSWAIHFLNENPEVKAQLYDEIDRVLGKREPEFADLPQLSYTHRVIQETLRLRTPGFWIPRHSVSDDEIDGYRIPADRMVFVMLHLIHYHPEIWDEPERFDPDRFLPENTAKRDPFSYIPFGSGQRQCIGRDFATMEAQLMLVRLLQRFHIEAVPGEKARPYFIAMVQKPSNVMVTLTPRDQ